MGFYRSAIRAGALVAVSLLLFSSAQAQSIYAGSPENFSDCNGVINGTAQDLGCGCGNPAPGACGCSQDINRGCGCGKPAPNECGCTGQTDQGCGCGQGTSCLSSCPYNIISVYRKRGDGHKEVNYAYDKNNRPAHIHPCVDQRLKQWDAECAGDRNGSKDCLAKKILGPYFKGGSGIQYVTFDAACNLSLSNEAFFVANKQCLGMWTQTASPISLIIGPGDEVDGRVILTQFPLNPAKSGMWYQWRASARAPLLVYDPGHKGEIASAHQLFGEWTFGGKRIAAHRQDSLADIHDGMQVAWNNGFEALATLDANGDEKISDVELEPLGLWFDENRDGVSQKGEVRTLAQEGITTLFFKPDRQNGRTRSIYVTHGYERVVDGSTQSGIAVDWYGTEGMSRDQLIATLASINQMAADQKSEGSDLKPAEYGALERALTDTDGLWQWSYPDGSYGGILGLYGLKNGGVRGFSLVDTTLSDQAKERLGAEHVAAAIPLRGSFAQSAGSKERTIKFTIYGADSAHIETTVNVSEDGTRLKGRSRILSGMKDEHGNDLTYSWTAERFKTP
jgi:hypothetical protein